MSRRSIHIAAMALVVIGAAHLSLPASSSAHTLAANAWRPAAALPIATEGMTALRLADGSVLALGSDATLAARNRIALHYLPQADEWQRLPDAPVALDTPGALELNPHAVLVVAPSFANRTIETPSQALLLDPLRNSWQRLPALPVALLSPRLVRLGLHTVFAAGGAGNTIGALFDLTTQRWTAVASPVPNLATYTLAALSGGHVLLVAGVASDTQRHSYPVRRAYVLDAAQSWREVARPPVAVDGGQAVQLDATQLLLAGGYPMGDNPMGATPPALIYDSQADRWALAGDTGVDHRGGQLVALGDGRAILVGGHGPDGRPSASCLLFVVNRWLPIQSLPGPWAAYALVSLSNGTLMLIGGDRPSGSSFSAVAQTMLLPLPIAQG